MMQNKMLGHHLQWELENYDRDHVAKSGRNNKKE